MEPLLLKTMLDTLVDCAATCLLTNTCFGPDGNSCLCINNAACINCRCSGLTSSAWGRRSLHRLAGDQPCLASLG
jgi:hypothetical protein